jgi:hypothetical protein
VCILIACLPFFLFHVCHWVRVHTACAAGCMQQKSLLCQRTWPEFLRRRARSLLCALYSSPQLIEKFTLDDARRHRSHSRTPFSTFRLHACTCAHLHPSSKGPLERRSSLSALNCAPTIKVARHCVTEQRRESSSNLTFHVS